MRPDLSALLSDLYLQEELSPQTVPDLDLYMDQLISLFEKAYAHQRRYPQDKLLTKTMINNYTKKKLLPPARKKKYSKAHIFLLALIYRLKQVCSLEDIQLITQNLQEDDIAEFYTQFLALRAEANAAFEEQAEALEAQIKSSGAKAPELDMLFAAVLFEQSLNYKRLAEKLLDTLPQNA